MNSVNYISQSHQEIEAVMGVREECRRPITSLPTTSWGRTCWPPTVGASIPLKLRYWGLSGVKVANNNAIAARKGAARRTARAELYRRLNLDYQPTYWGFRLFNGGQQQITVLLGNPHLHEHQNYVDQPD